MRTTRALLLIGIGLALSWVACGGDDGQGPQGDVTPPSRIANLAIDSVSTTTITLRWTAPGDDGSNGRASSYQLKRSDDPIDASNFSAAITISGLPAPASAHSVESFMVTGLDSTLSYYFALRAVDEVGNESPVSNNASWPIRLTKVIPAFKDNTLYEEIGACDLCPGSNGGSLADSLSNGAGEYFFIGRNKNGGARRALFEFAIADSLAADAAIDSVVLTLNMSKTTAGVHPSTLHRVLADWGEGVSDASCCAQTAEEGAGGSARVGDATWLLRFFRSTAWTSPGGDFVAGASASRAVNALGLYAWRSAQMTADVQGWLDTPSSNFGWILLGDETANTTAKRFDAHESGATGPRLTVYYTVRTP